MQHDDDYAADAEGYDGVSRRDFAAGSAAAGIAVGAATTASAGALAVTETNVTIKTPDGTCDAAFYHPTTGRHPGVLIWADAFGLRPAMRDFGRRMAGEGFAVLVPNPFYRVAKAPVFDNVATFDFANQADRAKLTTFTTPLNAPGAAERDAAAYIAFLDAQGQVDKARKIGTQGYCMGGPLIMKTAATVPGRVGAAASFHGGGLVTDQPTSPHLMIPKMQARLYIGIADNDDKQQPTAKDTLKAALAAAGKTTSEVEVYTGAQHGWCVPDMPARGGVAIYSRPDAERAWAKLVAVYKASL